MPVAVSGLTGATAVSAGYGSTCALLSGGTVQCWGANSSGQLGDGTTTDSLTPVPVSGLTGATAISVGFSAACALLSDGTVRCWGDDTWGELGDGSTTGPDSCDGFPCAMTPVAVTGLTGATAVSMGLDGACAVLSDGTVRCWGNTLYGLGNGTTSGPDVCTNGPCSTAPVAVSGLTGATAVSLGGASCALLSGGTVQCWGFNNQGELGNGTATGPDTCNGSSQSCSTTPVAVRNLTGATAISVGNDSACALLSGGTVKCWGDNGSDELGDGTTTGPDNCAGGMPCSTTPVAVQ
jgi:alpha-tubulin suppressor-like RCC1 family protein